MLFTVLNYLSKFYIQLYILRKKWEKKKYERALMNYSIFNVCSCSNMISVTGFVNLLEKRKIGEISAKAERTGGIFQQYATKSNFMCCSISFKTPVTTANFNQPTNNLACNKKLTTYKQSINVAMWYVWYCSNFHSKKKKGGKERKIFKSQKKKIPLFRISIFPILWSVEINYQFSRNKRAKFRSKSKLNE